MSFSAASAMPRQASSDEAREGMRNGYCPTTIKTTAGPVTLELTPELEALALQQVKDDPTQPDP